MLKNIKKPVLRIIKAKSKSKKAKLFEEKNRIFIPILQVHPPYRPQIQLHLQHL